MGGDDGSDERGELQREGRMAGLGRSWETWAWAGLSALAELGRKIENKSSPAAMAKQASIADRAHWAEARSFALACSRSMTLTNLD